MRITIFPCLEGGKGGWQAALPTPYRLGKKKQEGGVPANQAKVETENEALPQSVVQGLARAMLPQMRRFFESEQGRQTLEQWRAEREPKC